MNKFTSFVLVLVMFIALANVTMAAGAAGGGLQGGFASASYSSYMDTTNSPFVLIGNVLQSVLTLMGAVAVIMIIYAGVTISASRGNEEAVKKGKKMITYAIMGLIIIIVSWSIVSWVTGTNSFLWSSQQTV
jgi:hypothetical protein